MSTKPMPPRSRAQLARYTRHLSLPGVGVEGQERIANAKVLIVGAGGLGSPIASYLIAAGVGELSVIDPDTVELSNLQRQTVHRETDQGQLKVESVRRLAEELNSEVSVRLYAQRLDPGNALELFAEHDVVIDGSDNFATRYLSNDAAELTQTPLVWGTIFQFSGQVSVFDPRVGPMLRDIFPDLPEADSVPSCAEGGVFGALCGVIGSLMATEALKLITGVGEPLSGKLWLYDALEASVRILTFARDPERAPVTGLGEYTVASCAVAGSAQELDASEFELLRAAREVLVVDVRQGWERELAVIPGSVHFPLERLANEGWRELQSFPATELVFVCKTGVRSLRAATELNQSLPEGSARVRSLRGGTLGWLAEIRDEIVTY
ncbi:adenylyltransferase/sulfurtransferase MoeZ [Arthrobacter sp. MYb224]|uniref:ThiF family adenylyltransferase n=1 Tax=Arthrobacter sp. MYb224 TaxID=1848600 RepID=UPI000CFC4349|nr:ThiF family adenylyltransferase [Arthrobacter sp. MYb224]PQZ99283.1 adenylyltransferase/sulfurtransferase MoeZ [Arthrobacter sp. MYb224]